MPKSVNEVFRDFVRYTGDGLPGAPLGRPLPHGDPASGQHIPRKADIREALGGIIEAADDARQAVEDVQSLVVDVHGATLYAGDLSSLLASTATSYPAGTVFGTRREGHSYQVVASDHDLMTAGGVRLRVLPGATGYNLKAFGAVGDGVADDAPAAQKWLERVINNDATGFIPDGLFRFNSMVTLEYNAMREFTIRGNGEGSSQILVPATNADGALKIVCATRGGIARFADFTIWRQGSGGVGLWMEEVQGGNSHRTTQAASRISVLSWDRYDDHFHTGIALRGGFQVTLDNCTVEGPFLHETSHTLLPSSMSYACRVGIDVDGSYDPNITKCMAQNCRVGVSSRTIRAPILSAQAITYNGQPSTRITTTVEGKRMFLNGQPVRVMEASVAGYNGAYTVQRYLNSDDPTDLILVGKTFEGNFTGYVFHESQPESFHLREVLMNQTDIGVDFVRYDGGREPNFWCADSHVNYRTAGVRIEGAMSVMVDGMSFYNHDQQGVYPLAPVDLDLVNCVSYIVTNNHFDHITTHPNRVNVRVDSRGRPFQGNAGDWGIIANNSFKSGGQYGVLIVSATTRGVQIGPNLVMRTYSGGVYRDFSTHATIVMPTTTRQGSWVPELSFGGSSTGITYGARSAKYTISGGVMTFEIAVTLTNRGSATGQASVSMPGIMQGPQGVVEGGYVQWTQYVNMSGMANPSGRVATAAGLALTLRQDATTIAMTRDNFTNTSSFILAGTVQLEPKA